LIKDIRLNSFEFGCFASLSFVWLTLTTTNSISVLKFHRCFVNLAWRDLGKARATHWSDQAPTFLDLHCTSTESNNWMLKISLPQSNSPWFHMNASVCHRLKLCMAESYLSNWSSRSVLSVDLSFVQMIHFVIFLWSIWI
jgi:hypothetical protein